MFLSDLMNKVDEIIAIALKTGYDPEDKLDHLNKIEQKRDELLDMIIVYTKAQQN